MAKAKFKTLKSVIVETSAIAAGQVIELDPESPSTKALIATKHIEAAKAEKPEKDGDKK